MEELAHDFVENTARMGVYADVHAYLPRFQTVSYTHLDVYKRQ